MTNKIGKKLGSVQPSPSSQPASRQVDNCNNISEGCGNMQKDFERQEQKKKLINGICFVVVNSLLCEAAFLIKTSGFIKA